MAYLQNCVSFNFYFLIQVVIHLLILSSALSWYLVLNHRFLFLLLVNCKLSLASLNLSFLFCTHCPALNSLASRGQCFCYILCLLIKVVVVVVIISNDDYSNWMTQVGNVCTTTKKYTESNRVKWNLLHWCAWIQRSKII